MLDKYYLVDLKKYLKKHKGQSLFYIGIFFLPSAVFIGSCLISISIILSIFNTKVNFLKDKWNYPFLICSLLMLISTLKNNLNNIINPSENYDYTLAWINLIHWLPYFFSFYFLQKYLKTEVQRLNTSIALLSGSIPVIISGYLQFFFHWYGPFQAFNGLIIWFQKPIDDITQFSGLFSNQNYMGSWLGIVLPFCICALLRNKNNKLLKFISFFIIITISQGIILSTSRNALGGSLAAILIPLGLKSFIFLGSYILIFILLFFIKEKVILFENISFEKIFPYKIINKFPDLTINNFINLPRIEIWTVAIEQIKQRPFWGWGGSLFPITYLQNGGKWNAQHTHNIILELSHNYGLILAILLSSTILFLFLKTFNLVVLEKSNIHNLIINKCWLSSTLFVLITHLSDITYFDIRVSLITWILLAGNKCILETEKLNN